jgi:hypothetical protein
MQSFGLVGRMVPELTQFTHTLTHTHPYTPRDCELPMVFASFLSIWSIHLPKKYSKALHTTFNVNFNKNKYLISTE